MSFFRKPTPLPVQQGGTGDQYFDYGYAIIGNGYGALLELTPSTSGNVMTSNGTTWTSAPPSGGGGMVYPAAGIANSTGSAWASSYSTTGANSVVVRDANQNISVNAINTGFTNVAAAGTTTTLTAASTPNFVVTGSGGQTYQLPDATTLPNGAIFTFNNNQSSGTIVVKNNSSTTVVTVQSGGFVVVVLQSNSIAAGTWDYHAQAPSNVSWSTNTFNYVGSITGATWNGTTIGIAYGGTGQTTASAGFNALSPITTTGDLILGNGTNSATRLAIGANTYVLTSNGTTASWQASSGGGASQATATALGTVYAKQTTGGGTPYLTAFGYNAGVSTTGAANTAIGTSALFSNTTSANSTAVGYQSAYTNTSQNVTAIGYQAYYSGTCQSITAVGYQAGYSYGSTGSNGSQVFVGIHAGYLNISGIDNTYIGGYAAEQQTGSYNTAVGSLALLGTGASTGGYNTAVGYKAGYANTTAQGITAIGYGALVNNTTGSSNTAVGGGISGSVGSCLESNTTGANNCAFGLGALANNSTASNNTAIGYKAGSNGTTGASNVFVGHNCGANYTTGQSNVGVGAGDVGVYNPALWSLTSGTNNTAIGAGALNSVTTGSYNTAIGDGANPAGTNGGYNICVGYNTGLSANTSSREIVIGSSNGSVGKGYATGFIDPLGGGVYQGNNSAAWSVASDQRLKKNIVDNNVGLEKVAQIQVRNFEYRTEDEVSDLPKNQAIAKQGVQLGVIAQELQQILPDCVTEQTTGVLSVNSDNIMWHMINAIKELNAEITALKAKVGI